jgi:hypothetical protein
MLTHERWTKARKRRADKLRSFIGMTRGLDGYHSFVKVLRDHRWYLGEVPVRPTKHALLDFAAALEEEGRFMAGRAGSCDTETYSACGADDYFLESAAAYAREAKQIRTEVMGGHYVR